MSWSWSSSEGNPWLKQMVWCIDTSECITLHLLWEETWGDPQWGEFRVFGGVEELPPKQISLPQLCQTPRCHHCHTPGVIHQNRASLPLLTTWSTGKRESGDPESEWVQPTSSPFMLEGACTSLGSQAGRVIPKCEWASESPVWFVKTHTKSNPKLSDSSDLEWGLRICISHNIVCSKCSNAQNPPSQASTVHELWTSRCSSWI